MKRVLFFGASVTAQSQDNGYFDVLRPRLQALGIGVERLAHGSCHFDDAGFHAMPDIPWSGLTHCLLDWNTTGLARMDPVKLHFVVDQMLAHGVQPSFMILPQDRNLSTDREAETQVIALSRSLGLPWLDLRPDFQPAGLLRDSVHTTPAGAQHHARRILGFIEAELMRARPPDFAALRRVWHAQQAPATFWFGGLPGPWDVPSGACLEIDYRLTGPLSEILFDLRVGPDSPLIEVTVAQAPPLRLSLWDPWCHYERRKMSTLVPARLFTAAPVEGTVRVFITANRPAYHTCRRPGFDYQGTRTLRALSLRTANVDALETRVR